MQLKGAEKNYPVHKKELLMIICALNKWCSDLLGMPIFVYTDHHTLENFDSQKDLSHQQLCWQEFMSKYDMSIVYIHGEDNTVAHTLSQLPPNCFPDRQTPINAINAVLSIETDNSVLQKIKSGYLTDEFCLRVASSSMKGWQQSNSLCILEIGY
jgi:hypothetical protein